MKEFSVLMAIVDFIPVLFFSLSAVILQRALYNKMSKGAFALFAAGTIDVIAAGGLKALYKLLYALQICDFQALNTMMFPLQSIGFLLAGVSIVALLTHRQGTNVAYAAAPVVWKGTMMFVCFMVAGLGCIDFGLCVLAKRLRRPGLIAVFIASFLCSVCMGYLSPRNFDSAAMNWLAEGINIIGQGLLFVGVRGLIKAGLTELQLKH